VSPRNGTGPASALTDREARKSADGKDSAQTFKPLPKNVKRLSSPAQGIISIKKIKIGKRHRRDLGDIAALATSIAEIGAHVLRWARRGWNPFETGRLK
jgi:hypothetical protein